MPAVGTSIKVGSTKTLWALCLKHLGFKRFGTPKKHFGDNVQICYAAEAPLSNNVLFNPTRAGVFIVDTVNQDVYFCSVWVSSTSFTIVKLTP